MLMVTGSTVTHPCICTLMIKRPGNCFASFRRQGNSASDRLGPRMAHVLRPGEGPGGPASTWPGTRTISSGSPTGCGRRSARRTRRRSSTSTTPATGRGTTPTYMGEYPIHYSSAVDVSSVELYWDVPGDPLYQQFVYAFMQGITRGAGRRSGSSRRPTASRGWPRRSRSSSAGWRARPGAWSPNSSSRPAGRNITSSTSRTSRPAKSGSRSPRRSPTSGSWPPSRPAPSTPAGPCPCTSRTPWARSGPTWKSTSRSAS